MTLTNHTIRPTPWPTITQSITDQFLQSDISISGAPNAMRASFLGRFCDEQSRGAQLDQWLTQYPDTNEDQFPLALEARRLTRFLVHTLFDDWEFLHNAVRHSGSTIQARWIKRGKKERRKLLLQASPHMEAIRRPDLCTVNQMHTGGGATQLHYVRFMNSRACTLPHINQENLVQSSVLLLLLDTRGCQSPNTFAATEFLRALFARWDSVGLFQRMNGYTVSFDGNTRESYGRVLFWPSFHDGLSVDLSGRGMHIAKGIQLLLIQTHLMRFLRKLSMLILQDTSMSLLIRGPSLPLPMDLPRNNIMTAADAAIDATYRAPAFDFSRVRALLTAKINELEEQSWALREDPGLYVETFEEHRTHRMENVEINGISTEAQCEQDQVVGGILRDMIYDSHIQLQRWYDCRTQLQILTQLQCDDDFSHCLQLSAGYSDALEELWILLLLIILDNKLICGRALTALLPLRKYFSFELCHSSGRTFPRATPNLYEMEEDMSTKGFFARMIFLGDGKKPASMGYSLWMDELETHLEKHHNAKHLLSPYLAYVMSHISVASLCISELRLFMPWIQGIEQRVAKRMDSMSDYRHHMLKPKWETFFKAKWQIGNLVSLADPSQGSLDYPVGLRRNRSRIQAMVRAEQTLDDLWTQLDLESERILGSPLSRIIDENFTRGRIVHRTRVWADAMPKGTSMPLPEPLQSFSLLDHNPTSQFTGNFDRISASRPKKAKCRLPADPLCSVAGGLVLPDSQRSDSSSLSNTPVTRSLRSNQDSDKASSRRIAAFDRPVNLDIGTGKGSRTTLAGTIDLQHSLPEAETPLTRTPVFQARGSSEALSDSSESGASMLLNDGDSHATGFTKGLPCSARRVFRALFHSSPSDSPKKIPWNDFLRAMVAAGFTAEKLHGSAWQFNPKSVVGIDVRRPIQFHEPHPSSKLSPTWARRYGRRLDRAYGWNGTMFA